MTVRKKWGTLPTCRFFLGVSHDRIVRHGLFNTYRVAISNGRIESIEGDPHHGRVTFWYKDHRHHKVWRRTTLPGVEFLRWFCAHLLPRGFVRIYAAG